MRHGCLVGVLHTQRTLLCWPLDGMPCGRHPCWLRMPHAVRVGLCGRVRGSVCLSLCACVLWRLVLRHFTPACWLLSGSTCLRQRHCFVWDQHTCVYSCGDSRPVPPACALSLRRTTLLTLFRPATHSVFGLVGEVRHRERERETEHSCFLGPRTCCVAAHLVWPAQLMRAASSSWARLQ